ncbi:MAG: thioredoxin family protein [Burkholderiaceae bacterium]|jgi:protein disulfide-isomerase
MALFIGIAALHGPAASAVGPLPYDEQAEPQKDLMRALSAAREEHKRVLIVFGANWCEDCRALDRAFHDPQTGKVVGENFVVVKVDVGHFDKNVDFAKVYGNPIAKGIPSVVVVTPKNELVYETRAGELADARRMGPAAISSFFTDLSQRPAGY